MRGAGRVDDDVEAVGETRERVLVPHVTGTRRDSRPRSSLGCPNWRLDRFGSPRREPEFRRPFRIDGGPQQSFSDVLADIAAGAENPNTNVVHSIPSSCVSSPAVEMAASIRCATSASMGRAKSSRIAMVMP